jgi:ribosomal protein S3AE
MVLKKKFFEVEIPIMGEEMDLLAYEIQELDGKNIKLDLTRILRGKSTELKAKIKVEGNKAVAHPESLTILPYYIRRAVRKGTNYIEDSFIVECKDAEIIMKPFLVTRKKVSRAVRKTLRNKAKEEILNFVKNKEVEEIFEDLLKNKFQKPLSLILKKIYPLSLCEIRVLEIKKRK